MVKVFKITPRTFQDSRLVKRHVADTNNFLRKEFQTMRIAPPKSDELGGNVEKGRGAAIREECHGRVENRKFDSRNNFNPNHRHDGGSITGNGINFPVRDGDDGAIVVVGN